jgi:DNA-binding LacI/PurR family transcriptional regulator
MTTLPVTRRDQLLEMLRRDGMIRVTDVASALGVTPVTVRRDITQLAGEGLVRRVHGGATLLAAADDDEDSPAAATLGMVVPSLDYYWPGVLQGAREAAARLGVRVVLRGSSYEVEDDERQVTGLVDTVGVDGLLIAPNLSGPGGDALLARLDALDIPVVLVERTATVPPHHAPMESVVSDHALGASIAVHHLAALGHRRVGLAYSKLSPTAPKVRAGWLAACDELGLEATPDLPTVNYRDPLWRAEVDQILDACLAAGTTSLLVHSDPEAISLVERCEERGIRVPGQLSVVAYDDEVAGLANPPLTAVRPPRRSIGRTAVELLVGRLGDPTRSVHRVTVTPELMIRESTAPPS